MAAPGSSGLREDARVLVLMRHAKSDWEHEGLPDHDRPLNERGRAAAPQMGRWLEQVMGVPDRVLCSSSRRTRETLELMQEAWGRATTSQYSPELYLATPEEILRQIRSDAEQARLLLVLGHNPGMEQLAGQLAGQSLSFPTAAAAIFELSAGRGWDGLHSGGALRLIKVGRPREIADS